MPSARCCCCWPGGGWPVTMAKHRRLGCFGCCCCYRCCYRLLRCQLVMQSTNQTRASVNVKEALARRVESCRLLRPATISFNCALCFSLCSWFISVNSRLYSLIRWRQHEGTDPKVSIRPAFNGLHLRTGSVNENVSTRRLRTNVERIFESIKSGLIKFS